MITEHIYKKFYDMEQLCIKEFLMEQPMLGKQRLPVILSLHKTKAHANRK